MKRTLAAIAIIALAFAVRDGGARTAGQGHPEIRAAANPPETTIGVPVAYTVIIAGKNIAEVRVNLPEKKEYFPKDMPGYQKPEKKKSEKGAAAPAADEDPAELIPVFALSDIQRRDSSDKELHYQTISLTVTCYRTGTYRLPELDLRGADGIKIGYQVPSVTVKPVNEKGEFQEIEPPLELGGNYYRLIIVVHAALALAAAGYFLWRYIARLRQRARDARTPVPPIERFMDDVHTLRARQYVERGDVEGFCVELSHVFRRFVSGQFGTDAMEMTAGEIMHYLEHLPGKRSLARYRDEIDRVLNLWDLMKFAEFVPSKEVLDANLDATIALAKKLAMEYGIVAAPGDGSRG